MQKLSLIRVFVTMTAILAATMLVRPSVAAGGSVPVALVSAANVSAIVSDGSAPTGGGLDTHGYALSGNLIGTSITWSGVTLPLGAAGRSDAVSNATIALPAGSFGVLTLVGLGTNGDQPDQPFVVTYTDGTTSGFTQSVSDWWAPQNHPGESTVLTMAYCVTPNGGRCQGPQALYGYSFPLNGVKTVKSLTLPGNRNVIIVAAALSGSASIPVSLSGAANVDAFANDGTVSTNGGLIGSGYAISTNLAGSALAWSGATFAFGGGGVADAVTSSTLALPSGMFTAVKLIAVGARGNQTNQNFVVTYTDGTTTVFRQSLSDWWNPMNNPGETTVLNMPYCVTPSGGKCGAATALYGYSFSIDSTRTVRSLTLPNNRDVIVLAVALTGGVTAPGSSSTFALAAADYSVLQSGLSATVSVTRTGTTTGAASVQYATVDGSGVAGTLYTAASGTLNWAANDASAKSLTVKISNAAPFSGNESFGVALSSPSPGATLGSPNTATVTVTGDAAAASSLQFAATSYTVAENAGSVAISVTRSGGTGSAVSVAYGTTGGTAVAGTNYSSTSGTLNWAAADAAAKTITVAVTNAASMTANSNFSVNLATPGGGATLGANATATVTITPVAQSSGPSNSAQVIAYLSGLNTGSSRRVLSGQHADIWNQPLTSPTAAMDVVTPLAPQTGQNPAILGLVLNYATDSYAYTVAVTDTLAKQWWSAGGMVMLSLYDNDPTFSFNSTGAPTGQPIPSAAFHSLASKGSAAYVQWHTQLDTYAAALHTLTDSGNVVLFRPFIEINGNWNWYGGESPADFIAVWKDMHDYLTITKGVKNLVWIYNVNQDVGNYLSYYPGSAYVDVVGMDLYRADPVNAATNGNMYAQLVSTGKPLIIPEMGLSAAGPANYTQDDMVIINSIRNSLPNVVGFVEFNGGWSIVNQNNASALMNDPWIINLADIPGGL